MTAQVIEKNGKPEWAVLPYTEYVALLRRAGVADDQRAFDQAHASIAQGEEIVPAETVDRLLAGEHPLKVWREYRGLTQEDLAQAVGVKAAYLSQIETGRRGGSANLLKKIAQVLKLDLDDLVA